MSDFIIKPSEWKIDGSKYKPGDRLILQGPRAEIQFHGFKGTKESPIIVTGDKVLIKALNPGSKVVQFLSACDHFIFGGENSQIEVTGGAHGVWVDDCSNHPEVSYLYVHHTGATGIAIKTYPTCDQKTWRGNFTLDGMKVHHNRLEYIGTEGMYLGCSHYDKYFPLNGCSGGITRALEHEVTNAQVYDNVVKNCGADGIQLGSATSGDNFIRFNQVYNTGTAKIYGQASGIQANPGSMCDISDNVIDGCTNFGVIHQGRPVGSSVRRNLIRNTVGGIMTVARELEHQGKFVVEKNTFENITGNGVQAYTNTDFRDNVLQMKPGALGIVSGTPIPTLYKAFSPAKITTTNNFELVGNAEQLGLDASGVPTELSKIPTGVGYRDYVKPKPPTTKEIGSVELITTGGIEEWYLTTPSGKRKKME